MNVLIEYHSSVNNNIFYNNQVIIKTLLEKNYIDIKSIEVLLEKNYINIKNPGVLRKYINKIITIIIDIF